MARKPSLGRQKIEIAKIEKKNHLQVTFSKRRSGLFKKASELSTLCGVEVAIVVFSPAEKAFSFGHPNVDSVVDRFLSRNVTPQPNNAALQMVEARRNANVRELNMQLTQLQNQLEAEKKRGEALEEARKASQSERWWEAPIEELSVEQLEQLHASLQELRKNVGKQAEKLMIESMSASPYLPVNGVHGIGIAGNNPYESKPNLINPAALSSIPPGFGGYAHVHGHGVGGFEF
ncbi:Transcription factor, MADS-box [Dillenia turbinata]|uniref:Transcription factor, MADS-box n=1 Tax=Dillenia turbinata TaxID=194707 RepID=A0AAN8ZQI7_9MAGN